MKKTTLIRHIINKIVDEMGYPDTDFKLNKFADRLQEEMSKEL